MATLRYNITAVSVRLWFNTYGDHDHNGKIIFPANTYILSQYKDILAYLKRVQHSQGSTHAEREELKVLRDQLARTHGLGGDPHRLEEWLPSTQAAARRMASHEGVFVFHDAGDFRGTEAGTNAHGLFGALEVEPAGSRWSDPETGEDLIRAGTGEILGTGLYVDVHQRSQADLEWRARAPFPNPDDPNSLTQEYPEPQASFREFVIFIHDEPEWATPHGRLESNPCEPASLSQDQLAHQHTAGTLMPISYRAEPMISRERELWRRIKAGEVDPNNILVNEEQHHSSWMFGDPQTPILKAYLGDPVRVRLVHAGVKETHVFHLHVYEWHAIPYRRESCHCGHRSSHPSLCPCAAACLRRMSCTSTSPRPVWMTRAMKWARLPFTAAREDHCRASRSSGSLPTTNIMTRNHDKESYDDDGWGQSSGKPGGCCAS